MTKEINFNPSAKMTPVSAKNPEQDSAKKQKKDQLKQMIGGNFGKAQKEQIVKQLKDSMDSVTDYYHGENYNGGLFYKKGIKEQRPIPEFFKRLDQSADSDVVLTSHEKARQAALFASSLLNRAAHHVLFKKSDFRDSKYIDNYKKYVEGLVSSQANHLKEGSKKYPELLKSFVNDLGPDDFDENGIFSSNAMAKLMSLVNKQIEVEKKSDEEEVKKLEAIVQEMSKKYSDIIENKVVTEDDMWKYRVLQMILLATPFSPISLISPFINALFPLLDGAGFASFIASFLSVHGPLGQLAWLTDKMELDKAVEWLLDGPLSFMTDTIDVVVDVFSPLIQSGLPLVESPLFMLFVGGYYSYARIATEYEHYEKFFKERKATKDGLKDKIIGNYLDFSKKRDVRAKDFGPKFWQEQKAIYLDDDLFLDFSLFLQKCAENAEFKEFDEYFSDIKFGKDKSSFVDFIKNPENIEVCKNPDEFRKFLENPDNKGLKEAIFDRFMLLDEVVIKKKTNDVKIVKPELEMLLKDSEEAKILIANNKAKRFHELYLAMAPKCGIDLAEYSSGRIIDLEQEIIKNITETLRRANVNDTREDQETDDKKKPSTKLEQPKKSEEQWKSKSKL